MNTDKIITVVGSSNMDLVANTPRIPAVGETILGSDFSMVPGGKGANQAVAAAKLGGNVFFIAKLGDDLYSTRSMDNFKAVGINTKYVFKTKEAPSGVALISVDENGNNSIIVIPGANHMLNMQDISQAETIIKQSKAIVCQLEIPMEVVEGVAELAKKYNVPFILDPAPAPTKKLSDKLLSCVDIITPNETEAKQITGIKITDDKSASQACDILLSIGIKTVILTMGDKGSLFVTRGEKVVIPRINVQAVDSTAAGDAFTGALAYYLVQGKTALKAAKLANQVAAYSVTQNGAQPSMPTIHQVADMMSRFEDTILTNS